VPVLDLHIYVEALAGRHYIAQRGDTFGEFLQRELANIAQTLYSGVVVDHESAVFRSSHVKLHAVDAEGLGLQKGCDGVLRFIDV